MEAEGLWGAGEAGLGSASGVEGREEGSAGEWKGSGAGPGYASDREEGGGGTRTRTWGGIT